MKTFKGFLNEEHDSLVNKLEKTRVSIHNHWRRGGEARHAHGRKLINRYNDIKDKLRDTESGETRWKEYCKKHGFDFNHEGHDHYS